MTQSDLAKKSGISYGGIQGYERGQIPKGDNLLKLARALECSVDWLMTGENFLGRTMEEIPPAEVREGSILYIEVTKGKQVSAPLPNLDPQMVVSIPKIEPVFLSGTDFFATGNKIIGYYFFRKDWLNKMGLAQGLVVMDIVGDSMKPTLEEGDTVMIDTNRKIVTGGNIYAIREGETILIKRLQPLVGGKIQILSDNREMYHPQELDTSKNALSVIGQIVWMARKLV